MMSLIKKFREPIKFSLIYIGIIIIFSLSYYNIGDQFYHPTVKYEKYAKATHKEVKIEVEETIKSNFREYYQQNSNYLDNNEKWLFKIHEFSGKICIDGFLSNLDCSYWRMLYLSMVTIRTLGYGDIVSLANFARIFVGIESVLVILMLGWFVNSVIVDSRKDKQ